MNGIGTAAIIASSGVRPAVSNLRASSVHPCGTGTMSDRDDHPSDSTDGRIERAKDAALGPHDELPSVGDEIGEAAGGISGVLVGAGIGSAAGPIGTLIGGIAGALGGWWVGRALAEAAGSLSNEDEDYCRAYYDSLASRAADRAY